MEEQVSSRQGRLEAERGSTMGRAATIASWEYLTIPETERQRLPQLGVEGWELVAISGDPGERLLYLKRPVQSLTARVTAEQRNRYYISRGLDPERWPQRDLT
jgi:hypothetical protein